MFNRSSGFSFIGDSTFNNVSGHQMNGTIHAGTINFNTGQAVAKRTKHDEFQYVKSGDMFTTKELHSEEFSEWDWEMQNGKLVARDKESTRRIIYDRQSKYTAMVYEGEDAQDLWEEDFRQFSRNKKPGSFQLFGINQSEIPALIFHHELIPFVQFFDEKSIWMIYIQHLLTNMECEENHLWMNTSSGILFSGPDGPVDLLIRRFADKYIVVPPTIDMLKDNTCLKFFINVGLHVDDIVLSTATKSWKRTYLDNLSQATAEDYQFKDSDRSNCSLGRRPYFHGLWRNPSGHLTMNIIGRLRFDTVYSPSTEAVARWPPETGSLWRWLNSWCEGLVEGTVLDNGLTRSKLDLTQGEEVSLEHQAEYNWLTSWSGWLSQSSWVFDAIGVTEGKEDFFIVDPPNLTARFTRRTTASSTLRNHQHVKETPPTPIYLFIHPLPMSVSELVSWVDGRPYFWSFDKTGQSRMSEEECERWGLAVLRLSTHWSAGYVELRSWPTHAYAALLDWQKARGFDPATSDWARSMSYPELEIVGARKVQEKKKAGSSWWEAVVGSGISAFGI